MNISDEQKHKFYNLMQKDAQKKKYFNEYMREYRIKKREQGIHEPSVISKSNTKMFIIFYTNKMPYYA